MSEPSVPVYSRLVPLGIAAFLLLVHAIYTPLSLFNALPKPVLGETDSVVQYVQALRDSPEVADAIAGRDKIGYVSDRPVAASGGGMGELRFYLSQYALAPVILEDRRPHPLVLANFEQPAGLEAFLAAVPAKKLVDVGPGRALVRMGAE